MGSFRQVFRDNLIILEKDDDDGEWYIQVMDPSGVYKYDGFWGKSQDKSMLEALEQAKAGANICHRAS